MNVYEPRLYSNVFKKGPKKRRNLSGEKKRKKKKREKNHEKKRIKKKE